MRLKNKNAKDINKKRPFLILKRPHKGLLGVITVYTIPKKDVHTANE